MTTHLKDYDYTKSRRQQKRREQLNKLAQELGFETWGKLETAALNQSIIIRIIKTSP